MIGLSVQDFTKFINWFRGIYGVCLKLIKITKRSQLVEYINLFSLVEAISHKCSTCVMLGWIFHKFGNWYYNI